MKYTVSIAKLAEDNGFGVLYSHEKPEDIFISSKEVNRPGLVLAGYTDFFDADRIQFFGYTEIGYLQSIDTEFERMARLEKLLSRHPAAILLTRGIPCPPMLLTLAHNYHVPILSTSEQTSEVMASLIAYLAQELAERIQRHGVLVEVYGEGVLLVGSSGVGKSETAVELIKRGHRLIADDAVEIRKVSQRTLVGSSPLNIRHFVEVRGVGVINARRLFGMGAVKETERLNLILKFEPWKEGANYSGMSFQEQYAEILGITLPAHVVPVSPGRNLSVIVEAAAMNNRQKRMGYNAAEDLLHSLGSDEALEKAPILTDADLWEM
ncbi:MAG: HPr(Ser) kinase/phosphatase [Oscillospiraceae bacterium]|jgi:HPr kinase/phosphorylase|nr:HPr(Ser) kinase/phosphatase [Oscillospiraceae bacterium]